METTLQIKMRAKNLCREIRPQNQYDIRRRNEKILNTLMKEFEIDYDTAKACFENNDRTDW